MIGLFSFRELSSLNKEVAQRDGLNLTEDQSVGDCGNCLIMI